MNLEELNYKLVEEKEGAKIWMSKEVRMCIIEMDVFDERKLEEIINHWNLKHHWVEKGTIVIFKDINPDFAETIREVELSEYFALRRHTSSNFKIPDGKKKNYKLTIKQGSDGDFNLDPQKELTSDFNANYYEFIAELTKDSVVTYPPILEGMIEISWMRYVANKFLTA